MREFRTKYSCVGAHGYATNCKQNGRGDLTLGIWACYQGYFKMPNGKMPKFGIWALFHASFEMPNGHLGEYFGASKSAQIHLQDEML